MLVADIRCVRRRFVRRRRIRGPASGIMRCAFGRRRVSGSSVRCDRSEGVRVDRFAVANPLQREPSVVGLRFLQDRSGFGAGHRLCGKRFVALLTEKPVRLASAVFPFGDTTWKRKCRQGASRDFTFARYRILGTIEPALPPEQTIAEGNEISRFPAEPPRRRQYQISSSFRQEPETS